MARPATMPTSCYLVGSSLPERQSIGHAGQMNRIHRIALLALLLVACFDGYLIRDAGLARPGDDYACLWVAGRLALDGQAGLLYDQPAFLTAVKALAPSYQGSCGYFYPPHALLVQAPFSLLPERPSQIAWLVVSALLLVGSLAAVCRPPVAALAALLHPSVMINANLGQNGLFSAALIGTALVAGSRPALAGIALAVLGYKPHLAAAVGLFFLIGGRWRPLAVAALASAGLVLVSLALFGTDCWERFLALHMIRANLLNEEMHTFIMEGSIFRSLKTMGVADSVSMAAQALGVAVGAVVMRHSLGRGDDQLGLAQATAAIPLILPRFGTYDLAFLALPAVLLSTPHRLTSPAAILTALLFWLLPVFAQVFAAIGWHVTPILSLLLVAGCLVTPSTPPPSREPSASDIRRHGHRGHRAPEGPAAR
jgi:hypothetical protein